ncbi:MAG: xanthine dehydrogenase family protein subunit M [Proteobacteria bacterium]|nr:xanthine dehydrogenase family protein subunit M [Pseudomonadota bacterium]
MHPLPYHRPTSLEAALELKASLPGARFIAGGTDVMVRLKGGAPRPSALISLRGIAELTRSEVAQSARLGAAASVADLLAIDALREGWPVLADAMNQMASPQIRSSATLGGNLCNAAPCADSAPALLVHGARVVLRGPQGERVLALEEFFAEPGVTRMGADELLMSIDVDPPEPGLQTTFLKKKRVAMDIAIASVAAGLVMNDGICTHVRFAAGSVAPVPMRLPATEAALCGHPPTDARIAEARRIAEEEVSPITDIRGGADYRRRIIGVYVERATRALAARFEGSE